MKGDTSEAVQLRTLDQEDETLPAEVTILLKPASGDSPDVDKVSGSAETEERRR